ncbi:MAG: hypothetical protein AB1609_22445 [Bacillota bacterium]
MSTQVQRYQQGRPPAQQEPKKFDVVKPQVPGIPPEIANQIIVGFRGEDGTVRAYVMEAGLELKLEQVAKRKKGIRLNVVIPISYAHESPEQMQKLFQMLPEQMKEKFLAQRDYDMAMFTTPAGTALYKGVLLFGDGTKIWDYGEASAANVKMSTLHGHLNHVAATRARLRTIRKATARGFLTPDQVCVNDEAIDEAAEATEAALLEADLAAAKEGLAGAGDTDLPFPVEDAPAPESAGVESDGGGGEAQPVAGPAPAGPGSPRPGAESPGQQVAGTVRPQPGASKVSKIQQAYVDAIFDEARKRNISDQHLGLIASETLGRTIHLNQLASLTAMELAAVHQAVVGRSEQGDS